QAFGAPNGKSCLLLQPRSNKDTLLRCRPASPPRDLERKIRGGSSGRIHTSVCLTATGHWCRPARPPRVYDLVTCRAQAENVSRLCWRGNAVAQDFDDGRGLLDQRGVARRKLALLEIQVVFEPDAHVPA